MKVTVTGQVAAGARAAQSVVGMKFATALVGGAIWRVEAPVLVRVMVCCVEVGPGKLLKRGGGGWGGGPAERVRGGLTGEVGGGMVRMRVRGPVVAGVKMRLTKQEVLGAREPL